jgi:putative two-component system response regulator
MKVLIAEDNAFYRKALTNTIREFGYKEVAVADGVSALEVLQGPNPPMVAILDGMMPKVDGLEVCRRIRAMENPEPPYLIILAAKHDKKDCVRALEAGADDFITKPYDREDLCVRIRVGVRIVSLQRSQTVAFAFAQAVEAKSPYTQGHATRVTQYSLALADALELPSRERETLRKGAMLHDIGKICVPDAILNKPDRLSEQEYDIIKQHPGNGVKMIQPLESLKDVIPLIHWHHERLDGKGYPDGLAGDQIPFLVRVLSIADCYDALSSDRPYRKAMLHEECLRILLEDARAGSLDHHLVSTFCNVDLRLNQKAVPAAASFLETLPQISA